MLWWEAWQTPPQSDDQSEHHLIRDKSKTHGPDRKHYISDIPAKAA